MILINALLFASEDYGFARVLSEEPRHAEVGVVVLVSGSLDEIRSRAAEQFGVTVLEPPTSAGELSEAIGKATGIRVRTSAPRPVSWGRSKEEPSKAKTEAQPTVPRVSWQAFNSETEPDTGDVRPVNWSVDGGSGDRPARSQSGARSKSAQVPPQRPMTKQSGD